MVSFILCLLPALLATTNAQAANLNCNLCSGTAASCQASTQTCPVDKAKGGCFTVAEENTLDGTKTTSFSRGCLTDYNSTIKDPVTVTLGNGKYLRINTTRCNDTDNCNSGTLAVPTGSTTVNGLQCPTCFALNVTSCNSQITPCTGDETYCIDFIGTIQNGSATLSLAAKGCATASTKDIPAGTSLVSAFSTYNLTKVTSNPAEKTPTSGASPALGRFSFALYLPGLTGLLLVKLLA
ncbi:phospholipase A2 inhibitor and Ly6/PLAUR domain-containing protein-like [Mauremys reevesii]|uniref:phospholipase A2 inhibitor and Ly6/PLAUR domain-containing protein-like n=1 Tax=Mauremys reevesii TaxID=260615 RepID=UPI00193FD296|nr:phospholipase A2 inhibitor and Ly6/PLAUR domain-containing protein-like [Mauremys reevesii]